MTRFFLKLMRFSVQVPLYLLERILDAVDWTQELVLALFFAREFERRGGCARTGQCCQAIGLEAPASWFGYPRLIRLFQKWHFLRYNFTPQGRQGNMLVYSCNYLTPEMTCGIQHFKPKLCRDFPQQKWRGFTKLHKGCGFYFEKKRGKDFGRILRNQTSTTEYLQTSRDDSHSVPLQKGNPKDDL